MTAWIIRRLPDRPGSNEDDSAMLDDGNGPGVFPGWFAAWEYIAGNVTAGDTVTVLEDSDA